MYYRHPCSNIISYIYTYIHIYTDACFPRGIVFRWSYYLIRLYAYALFHHICLVNAHIPCCLWTHAHTHTYVCVYIYMYSITSVSAELIESWGFSYLSTTGNTHLPALVYDRSTYYYYSGGYRVSKKTLKHPFRG